MNILYTILPLATTIALIALAIALTAREFKRMARRDRRYIARFNSGAGYQPRAKVGDLAMQPVRPTTARARHGVRR